mgnify:CR=1 FL=1
MCIRDRVMPLTPVPVCVEVRQVVVPAVMSAVMVTAALPDLSLIHI